MIVIDSAYSGHYTYYLYDDNDLLMGLVFRFEETVVEIDSVYKITACLDCDLLNRSFV
jgi:uncharacterized UBP type Zn finger protein